MVKKVIQPIYTAYVFTTFFLAVIVILPFILILSTIDSYKARLIIYFLIKNFSIFWMNIIGMPSKKIGLRPAKGKFVVVANHISYIDGIAVFQAIPGYFRPLGKKEMSKIPLFGLVYKQITIMVDRSSQTSRAKSMRLMWRVLKHDGSIIIFPEGTFNETDQPLKSFYDGAFKLAINTQVDILPIVFPDTVNRWHYSGWWKFTPGVNRIIYLPVVSVQGKTLEDLPVLKQEVFTLMEKALINVKNGDKKR